MDSIAGNDNVDIRQKKKEYQTEDEEEAEEDHLAPSYVPRTHLFLSYLLTRTIVDGGFLRLSSPS